MVEGLMLMDDGIKIQEYEGKTKGMCLSSAAQLGANPLTSNG
jgi:hypothetical protein